MPDKACFQDQSSSPQHGHASVAVAPDFGISRNLLQSPSRQRPIVILYWSSSVTNVPILFTSVSGSSEMFSVILLMMAEPTIAPFATLQTVRTVWALEIPKPTQIGRVVMFLSWATASIVSGGRFDRWPVMPATEM